MFTRLLSLSLVVLVTTSALAQVNVERARTPARIDNGEPAQPLPSRSVQRGLHVSMSDDGHVSGSFTKGKSTIYFEAIRGVAIESPEPESAPFLLDLSIQDENHLPFLVQGSGPTPSTRAWYEELATSQALPIDEASRRRAFAILPDASAALTSYADENGTATWEINQIVALMNSVKLSDIQDVNAEPEPPIGRIVPSATATYKHVVTIKRKPAFDIPWELEHSALLLQIYNSKGSLLTQTSSCNHGACATASSMTTKCSSSFMKQYITVYMWDLMCDSYGYWFGRHTCNTDTRQEYLSVKGSSSQNWGICSIPYLYAPNCD